MFEGLINGALVFLGTAGVAFVVGYIVVYAAEQSILHRDANRIEARFERMRRLAQAMEQRFRSRLPYLAELDSEAKAARRQQFIIKKRKLDLQEDRGVLVRTLGEDDLKPSRDGRKPVKFVATLTNEGVQKAGLEGRAHGSLSLDWAVPQTVEIWAVGLAEARQILEKAYPPAMNFVTLSLREVNPSPGPSSGSRALAR